MSLVERPVGLLCIGYRNAVQLPLKVQKLLFGRPVESILHAMSSNTVLVGSRSSVGSETGSCLLAQ